MKQQQPDWDQITELLAEAVDQPPEQRREWLRKTGQPPARIAKVESLLAAYESDPGFLEPDDAVPAKLGPWVVCGELGQGGMGRVFLATHEDPSLARRVALKVVGAGRAVPGLLEAFLQERAILARLEHPAIARLYDTGYTAEGLPYFAMEYVQGVPFDRWLQDAKPSLRDRVRMLAGITDAVAFAHSQFVAHGDLKPNNILVTPGGEPRLLDFGIARAWNVAEGGHLPLLTPAHASPEQLQGKPISAASDLFQLGLLLQTALQAPAQGAHSREGRSRELLAIVARCLQEAPEQRYPSAAALRSDLIAWLEHRPVSVVGTHPVYLLRKQLRRHPMAAALVAALILGTVAVAWQAQRAETHRAEAQRQFQQTRRFARGLLATIPSLPTTAQRSIVERTVGLLQQLSEKQEDDPVVQLELAFAWMSLGHVQGLPTARNLGDPERAAQSYGQAIALAERAHSSRPDDALPVLVTLYASAARVERSRNRQPAADALERKLRGLLPTLEQSGPSNSLAYAYSELAYLATAKDREAALALYQRAVETYSRVADPQLPQKAYSLKRWGALLLATNQLDGGIARYQQALAIERAIDVTPFDLSYTLSDLGLACRRQKRFAEAERYYREALAIRERVAADDPADVRAASALATIQWRLGWVFADAGRPEAAIPWGRRGVKLSEALVNSAQEPVRYEGELALARVYLAEFLVLAAAKASDAPKSLPLIARQIPEVYQLLQLAAAVHARAPDPNLAAELAALGVTLPDASKSESARMTNRR